MRHHEPLIAMRRYGAKPSLVDLEVGAYDEDTEWWPEWTPNKARVHIAMADVPQLLDLRFLVGCDVRISGLNPDDEPKLDRRLRQLFEAAIAAHANSVTVLKLIDEEALLWHA